MSVWLQRAPSNEVAARVFCIPHAGSGTSAFDNWPSEQDSVEFLFVELPGRLPRFGERPPHTLEDLCSAMIAGLSGCLDIPFAFFGHCWSAIVAYEVSRQLERAARRPAHLFISSEVPPQVGPFGRMLDMDETRLTAEVEASIREVGKTPHPELVSIYVRILREDIELRRGYKAPQPLRLGCPITAFAWTEDREYRPEQLAAWAECGETTLEVFPGRHERFRDAPPELIGAICARLSGVCVTPQSPPPAIS